MPSRGQRRWLQQRGRALRDAIRVWGPGSRTVQAFPDGVDDGQVVTGASANQQVKGAPPLQLDQRAEQRGSKGRDGTRRPRGARNGWRTCSWAMKRTSPTWVIFPSWFTAVTAMESSHTSEAT